MAVLCKTCNDTRHFCAYHGTESCDCAGSDCADCWAKTLDGLAPQATLEGLAPQAVLEGPAPQATLEREIKAAMWAGDTDRLHEIAPCCCCCDEHTFESCPARLWSACRGQGTPTHADLMSWADHYGMSLFEFLS